MQLGVMKCCTIIYRRNRMGHHRPTSIEPDVGKAQAQCRGETTYVASSVANGSGAALRSMSYDAKLSLRAKKGHLGWSG
jgi:hypothetical protein